MLPARSTNHGKIGKSPRCSSCVQLSTWHLMVLMTPRNSITLLLRHVVMSATSTHYAVCAPIAKWHVCCFIFSPLSCSWLVSRASSYSPVYCSCFSFSSNSSLLRLSSHHHLSSKLFNFCFSLLHFVPDLTGLFVTLELPLCLFPSAVQTTPPSSQLDHQCADPEQVLQHLWTCLSFLHLCLTCLSHRFLSRRSRLSLTLLLLWPCPAILRLTTCFPAVSNTDLESSALSLVLMT